MFREFPTRNEEEELWESVTASPCFLFLLPFQLSGVSGASLQCCWAARSRQTHSSRSLNSLFGIASRSLPMPISRLLPETWWRKAGASHSGIILQLFSAWGPFPYSFSLLTQVTRWTKLSVMFSSAAIYQIVCRIHWPLFCISRKAF